jgi:Leucine-rich repeat (LRR) protein
MPNLVFVNLSHNLFTLISMSFRKLKSLELLDLSNCQLTEICLESLPADLFVLSIEGNPCTSGVDYRKPIVGKL